jgi:signal transduction histidine kinase
MSAYRWMWIVPLLFIIAAPVSAQDVGTAAEAKAMLEKVAADLKANKAKTLQDISAGTYNKKDLYPFCGAADGTFTAHGANKTLVGQSMKDRKDAAGKAYGEQLYKDAQSGKFSEVSYMFPKPGETTPVAKSSYITKVDDQVCAVGYYK